jgi:hypothetical protein
MPDLFLSKEDIQSFAVEKGILPKDKTPRHTLSVVRFDELLAALAWRRLMVEQKQDPNAEWRTYWAHEDTILQCPNLVQGLRKKLEAANAIFLEEYPTPVANIYRSVNGKQLWVSQHLLKPLFVVYDIPDPYTDVDDELERSLSDHQLQELAPPDLGGCLLVEPPPLVLLPLRELRALPDTLIVPGEAEAKPSASVLQDLFDHMHQTDPGVNGIERVFTEYFPHLCGLLAPMTLHNCGTRWLFTLQTQANGQVEFYGLSCFPDLPPVHGVIVSSNESVEDLTPSMIALGTTEWQNTRCNPSFLDLINEGFTRPLNSANETSGDEPNPAWKLPPIELYSPFWSNAFIQGNPCSWEELVAKSRFLRTRDPF